MLKTNLHVKGNIGIFIALAVLLALVGGMYYLTMPRYTNEAANKNIEYFPSEVVDNRTEDTNINKNVTDLTLQPDGNWIPMIDCGMNYKKGPNFKEILHYQGTPENRPVFQRRACRLGFELDNSSYSLNVTLYSDYNGGSRRAFYLQKIIEEDRGIENYKSAAEFRAGSNNGLMLEFTNFKAYLIIKDSKTFIVIEADKDTEDIKKFLTSINTY